MRGCIYNTDFDWYRYLAAQRPEEVNFWRPGGIAKFTGLAAGEPLFFKLKKEYNNAVVGFGFYVSFTKLRVPLAWEVFKEANGAESLETMWKRIAKYVHRRPDDPQFRATHAVGCILLTSPVFFEPDEWVRGPADWHQNMPGGVNYDLSKGEGQRIWDECKLRLSGRPLPDAVAANLNLTDELERYGPGRIVHPRLGQGTFRVVISNSYQGACAISGERSLPVLEAAHIKPYSKGGVSALPNGLLLRADIHRLFDAGYVTVTPDKRFRVSRRLKENFDNGVIYYALSDTEIRLPKSVEDWPDPAALEWHNDVVFGAAGEVSMIPSLE
jgi:putative restriction endonuclease